MQVDAVVIATTVTAPLNVNKTSGNDGDNDNDGSSVLVISRESTHMEAVVIAATIAAAALL